MKKIFIIIMVFICVLMTGCNNSSNLLKGYVPSESKYKFSDKNLKEVSMKKTFDIENHLNDAKDKIVPYQIFADGMCLQRDSVNHIWGYAYESENIAVKINDRVFYGKVDEDSKFSVYLPMMNAGGPYEMEIISEAGRIVIDDVYIGEVYIFAGQSNMEWQIWISGNVMQDLFISPDVVNDQIRLLHIGANPSYKPTLDLSKKISWKGAAYESVRTFSAVAYIFGKKLQKELGCPVGLISTALGGTTIEHWMSEESYLKVSKLYNPFVDQNQIVLTPTLGYNGVLYPLKGINARGVVWYQGCANTYGTEKYYDQALLTLINQFREDFNNENLTFTICELARYRENPFAYSTINERINEVAKIDEKVVVARNLDLGNWYDIHPLDKKEIGKRAIDETLRVFYGKDIEEPVYLKSYKFNDDGTVTLEMSREVELVNGSNGFEVHDGGKYYYDCEVSVSGTFVTVSAKFPIAKVRYGYTCKMNTSIMNDVSKMVTIYDKNGIPLDLFSISR